MGNCKREELCNKIKNLIGFHTFQVCIIIMAKVCTLSPLYSTTKNIFQLWIDHCNLWTCASSEIISFHDLFRKFSPHFVSFECKAILNTWKIIRNIFHFLFESRMTMKNRFANQGNIFVSESLFSSFSSSYIMLIGLCKLL